MKRILLIFILTLTARHSYCQVADMLRRGIIITAVRSAILEGNSASTLIPSILSTRRISQHELLKQQLSATNGGLDDVQHQITHDSAKIKKFQEQAAKCRLLVEDHKHKNNQKGVDENEKIIRDYVDMITKVVESKEYKYTHDKYAALLHTRDSIAILLPAADSLLQPNYKCLVEFTYDCKPPIYVFAYLDSSYHVVCFKAFNRGEDKDDMVK